MSGVVVGTDFGFVDSLKSLKERPELYLFLWG